MGNVMLIPARRQVGNNARKQEEEKPKLRVAAYCRVSTDSDEQATSYEAQVEHYTEYIQKNPDWEFAGIYADDGISGTNTKKREEFNRMIEDTMAGKIDMIKSREQKIQGKNLKELNYNGMEEKFDKIVRGIESESEQIQVPESLSPENMKKRLHPSADAGAFPYSAVHVYGVPAECAEIFFAAGEEYHLMARGKFLYKRA